MQVYQASKRANEEDNTTCHSPYYQENESIIRTIHHKKGSVLSEGMLITEDLSELAS